MDIKELAEIKAKTENLTNDDIRFLRKSLGMTQKELADLLSVGVSTIISIEKYTQVKLEFKMILYLLAEREKMTCELNKLKYRLEDLQPMITFFEEMKSKKVTAARLRGLL